jgi:hypothetical protein
MPVYIAEGEFAGSTGQPKKFAGYRWFESISLQRRVSRAISRDGLRLLLSPRARSGVVGPVVTYLAMMAISRRAFGVGLVAASAAATGGYLYLREHPEIAGRFGEPKKLFGFAGGEKEGFLTNARVRELTAALVWCSMRVAQDRWRWCGNPRCSTSTRNSCGRPPRSSSKSHAAPASNCRATR